ncbi:peptidoglycan-binding domain-containing protein [Ruminiclostridium cellulolyticum]
MIVKEFQSMVGLTADGVAGPKTKEKAKELLRVCQNILGNEYCTAEV